MTQCLCLHRFLRHHFWHFFMHRAEGVEYLRPTQPMNKWLAVYAANDGPRTEWPFGFSWKVCDVVHYVLAVVDGEFVTLKNHRRRASQKIWKRLGTGAESVDACHRGDASFMLAPLVGIIANDAMRLFPQRVQTALLTIVHEHGKLIIGRAVCHRALDEVKLLRCPSRCSFYYTIHFSAPFINCRRCVRSLSS